MVPVNIRNQWSMALGLLIGSALWAGLPAHAGAHSGGRVYPIVELTDEMLEKIQLDDGMVDEWFELIGEPAMTLLDFKTPSNYMAPDPSNLDFRIWLAWHDDPDRLYVAFAASDDLYRNDHDYDAPEGGRSSIQMHDSITLAFDGDHSGGGGFSGGSTGEEQMQAYGRTQRYQAIARTVTGPLIDTPDGTRGFSWKVFPPYGDAGGGAFGEAPTISVIELYVTLHDRWGAWEIEETEFSDLAPGHVIGFAIMVNDWDENERGPTWWIPEAMEPTDPAEGRELDTIMHVIFVQADYFLDGILLPANAEPEGAAVGSVSWGRIKASLEME